jgi:hypothetical protein
MKNQNDLIFSICAIVVLLIAFFATYFTKPEPVRPGAPAAVNLAPPTLPNNVKPVMANALSGGDNNGAGGGNPFNPTGPKGQ